MFRLCWALDTLIMTSLVDIVVNEYVMHGEQYFLGGKAVHVGVMCSHRRASDDNSRSPGRCKALKVPSLLQLLLTMSPTILGRLVASDQTLCRGNKRRTGRWWNKNINRCEDSMQKYNAMAQLIPNFVGQISPVECLRFYNR